MTDYEKFKTNIQNYADTNLKGKTKDNPPKYECPFCGSGQGKHHTPALTIYNNGFYCYSCQKAGDIFDLVQEVEHLDKGQARRRVISLYGTREELEQQEHGAAAANPHVVKEADPAIYADFFKWATKNAIKGKYWQGRGFTPEEIERYQLGEIPGGDILQMDKAGYLDKLRIKYLKFNQSNYGVIPYGKDVFTLRNIDKGGYIKQKDSQAGIFHLDSLYRDGMQYCLIVEGEVDTLTIEAKTGLPCLATGSKSNTSKLLELLQNKPTKKTLFILPDNDRDETGSPDRVKRAAFENLAESLRAAGTNAAVLDNTSWKYKDPNEYYQKEPEQFATALQDLCAKAVDEMDSAKEKEVSDYIKESAGASVGDFALYRGSREVECIPTGYKLLDGILNGGLRDGLVTVSGLSATGKTTMLLQMALHIAADGEKDVIYIALEQTKYELMAKGISYLTYELCGYDSSQAIPAWKVASEAERRKMTTAQKELLARAEQEYSNRTSGRLYFFSNISGIYATRHENDQGWNVADIMARHTRLTGHTPVVFVDYLQILRANDPRATDKQNIDHDMTALKLLSNDFHTAIIVISSMNRASYGTDAGQSSLSGSAKIEYSSDLVLTLQPFGIDNENTANTNMGIYDSATGENFRTMELKVAKNRNGRQSDRILYLFAAPYNSYQEQKLQPQLTVADRIKKQRDAVAKRNGKRRKKQNEAEKESEKNNSQDSQDEAPADGEEVPW